MRRYSPEAIPDETLAALQEEIETVNAEGHLHVQLYYGERLVLLAQQLGLNSCWAGVSYRKVGGTYALEKDEKIACYIALGYGQTQGVPHKSKDIRELSNASDLTPEWFRAGVEVPLETFLFADNIGKMCTFAQNTLE